MQQSPPSYYPGMQQPPPPNAAPYANYSQPPAGYQQPPSPYHQQQPPAGAAGYYQQQPAAYYPPQQYGQPAAGYAGQPQPYGQAAGYPPGAYQQYPPAGAAPYPPAAGSPYPPPPAGANGYPPAGVPPSMPPSGPPAYPPSSSPPPPAGANNGVPPPITEPGKENWVMIAPTEEQLPLVQQVNVGGSSASTSTPTAPPLPTLPVLSPSEAKDVLIAYAKSKTLYKTKPAEMADIKKVSMTTGFFIHLWTFFESRQVATITEAYKNTPIDPPTAGPAPHPWAVECKLPPPFTDQTQKVVVPHTDIVQKCTKCAARGVITCQECYGQGKRKCISCMSTPGRERCFHCSGKGYDDFGGDRRPCGHCSGGWATCKFCHGSATQRCHKCSGTGNIQCPLCEGTTNTLTHQVVSVTFTTAKDDGLVKVALAGASPDDKHSPPDGKIISPKVKVQSFIQLEQIDVTEESISHLPKPVIDMVTGYRQKQMIGGNKVRRCTRLIIDLIPIQRIDYEVKGSPFCYHALGLEKKVYETEYPTKCIIM